MPLDPFDAAFAEAAKADSAAVPAAPAPQKAAAPVPDAAVQLSDVPDAPEPAAPPEGAPPAPSAAPVVEPALVTPVASTPSTSPSAAPAPAPAQVSAPPAASPPSLPPAALAQAFAPQPEPPLFGPEEVAQLQQFYTDWPDVARATEMVVGRCLEQMQNRIYKDLAGFMAPYLQTIDTLANRSQVMELQAQVPDYEAIADQLTGWAAQQPAYLRTAYEHVIKSGTATEVMDLIGRYRQATAVGAPPTGVSAPVSPTQGLALVAPAPAAPPAGDAAAAAAARVAAAARLAPVSTKRTNIVVPPADFDTAFAEFARAS